LVKCSVTECKNQVDFFSGKKCKFCNNPYCFDHIQFENHDCSKTTPTKHLRKAWLRKYGLNVSSGRYYVACDLCGYRTISGALIDIAEEQRKAHIAEKGCDSSKVFLEGGYD